MQWRQACNAKNQTGSEHNNSFQRLRAVGRQACCVSDRFPHLPQAAHAKRSAESRVRPIILPARTFISFCLAAATSASRARAVPQCDENENGKGRERERGGRGRGQEGKAVCEPLHCHFPDGSHNHEISNHNHNHVQNERLF